MRFTDELRKSGYDPTVSKTCFDARKLFEE
jgi:hypothetical protein